MNTTRTVSLAFALAANALAQNPTGRSLQLLAPAVVGQTAAFSMTWPATAAGNPYMVLWCSPQFSGTAPLNVPGMNFQGALLVDPLTAVATFPGFLMQPSPTAHQLPIPNSTSLVGYAWDLQSADIDAATLTVSFSDNELEMHVSDMVMPGMVPIAAGSFQMGSNGGYAWEQPIHTVHITRPFWMGEHEVTQAEYQAVIGVNPSFNPAPNHPVERVSWVDAYIYCIALTAQEAAANRLPAGYEYRMPTEAEWEYCCRAGTTTEWNVVGFNCTVVNHGSCVGSTNAVGSYQPNAWGLYNMHGNVSEWCMDRWWGTPNYPVGPVSDPFVNVGGGRIYRGGSFVNNPQFCRSGARARQGETFSHSVLGFRVVLAPKLF